MDKAEGRSKMSRVVQELEDAACSAERKTSLMDYLRYHLRRHPADLQKLVHAGIVRSVMQLLKGFSSPESPTWNEPLMASGTSLLTIVSTDESARMLLCNDSSVKFIVSFMENNYPELIRIRACRTISNMIHSNVALQHLLYKSPWDYLRLVVEMLATGAAYYEVTLRAIRHCATCSPSFRRYLIRFGAAQKISPLLQLDDVVTVQRALMSLSSLVVDSDSFPAADMFWDLSRQLRSSLPQLVQLAMHESPGVQQSSLDLLTRLAGNNGIRGEMGSQGVIACFLEQLAFDEGQTTISSMQKKITYALTLCCHEGFSRAKIKALGGLSVLVGILGSTLFSSLHLHVLSCLPEFRHDEGTLRELIGLGVIPLVVGFLEGALNVLHPPPKNQKDTQLSQPATVTDASLSSAIKFSMHSPSYKSELMELNNSQDEMSEDDDDIMQSTSGSSTKRGRVKLVRLHSPAISPPSMRDELRRELSHYSPSTTSSPCSSPSSCDWRPEIGEHSGRFSPVLDQSMDEDVPDLESKKRGHDSDSVEMDDNKFKRPRLITPPVTPTKRSDSSMSAKDAEKCLKYGSTFFEAISYRSEFTKYLAVRSVVRLLTNCIERMLPPTTNTAYQILLRIIRDRVCFEQLIKVGCALMLQETALTESSVSKEAKGQLLNDLRMTAESEYGFGELLHACLRSIPALRMTCIASASILLQTRPDRSRFFDRNPIMDQLLEILSSSGTEFVEEGNILTQAIHGFFCTGEVSRDSPTEGELPERMGPENCRYLNSLDGMKIDDRIVCCLDDDVKVVLNRATLRGASKVFTPLFGGNFLEGQESSSMDQQPQTSNLDGNLIRFKECDSVAFQGLVHHLCGCDFTGCDVLRAIHGSADDLLCLIQLADQFLAFGFRDLALGVLINHRIHPENISKIYLDAEAGLLYSVTDGIVDWILKCPGSLLDLPTRTRNLYALLKSSGKGSVVDRICCQLRSCL